MKRIFALILTVAITAAWLLVPVQAIPTSGTCGDLSWSYDQTTKCLTFTGTGPMDCGDYPPWRDLDDKVTSVVIEEGVTSVGYSAFANFYELHTVSLPKSVKTIEGSAFFYCFRLKNISLEHVTTLGARAFDECSGLQELIIPAGVTEIPHSAFSNCRKLQRVVFHDNVKTIGSNAFRYCTSLTSITIPDSVTMLDGSAFYNCSNLVTVNLGSGIQTLHNSVFDGCSKLESIRIPDSVTTIDSGAFSNCKTLKEVYLGAGVSEVAVDAFTNDPMLKAFTVSEKNPHLSVDQGVLYTADRKELVLFPYGFTGAYAVLPGTIQIRERAAYETGITALTVPKSVTVIGHSAFGWCEQLKTVRLSEGLVEIESRAFEYTGIEKIQIPASVQKIGQMVFNGCISMKQMVIYGEPPTIKELAFPRVHFDVFYPKKTSQWMDAQELYGGLPNWELQCKTHSYSQGACSRCGVTDPGAAELTGALTVAGNAYASAQIQLLNAQQKPLYTFTVPVGNYLFPELTTGAYTLSVSAEGYVTRNYDVLMKSGVLKQDISLQALGDTNGDGKISIGDVAIAYSHTRGRSQLTGYAKDCADLSGDGRINLGDVTRLYSKIRN